ncbi:MAG: hypothetical protein IT437_10420 [Phycisphaerales bacterium]|nr:hypothetical protein [Phycisphaerales bacterium]
MAWETDPKADRPAKSAGMKVVVALGAVVFFVTVSSWFRPAGTSARTPMLATTDRLLGEVEGNNYTLQVFAGPSGPLYTVRGPSGRVLRERLTADEVYRAFPDLDVRTLHAGTDLPPAAEITSGP